MAENPRLPVLNQMIGGLPRHFEFPRFQQLLHFFGLGYSTGQPALMNGMMGVQLA
ncbi:hypothetical protein D3C81_2167910 [compost metagenome]